jgi:hypothetical protein
MTTENLTATLSKATAGPVDHSEYFAKASGIYCSLAFVVACGLYALKSNEAQWGYVSAIFFLPLLQILAVIYTLHQESRVLGSKILLPAILVQMAFWGAYTWRESIPNTGLQSLAWCALGCAIVLAVVALWVNWLILESKKEESSTLKFILHVHPFMVTCFFLTVFTVVALFLSLSLAFHDQGLRLSQAGVGLFAEQVTIVPKSPAPPPGGEPAFRTFNLLFDPGSAVIKFDNEKYATIKEDQVHVVAVQDQQVAANTVKLREALAQIEEHSDLDRVRVVLEGHSDEKPVGDGPYKSNFELSQARVNQVMAYLLMGLGSAEHKEWRRNVEWQTVFCPDERKPERAGDKNYQPNPERLSVQISILPSYGDKFSVSYQPLGRKLDLLDYTYFGVYTITTTGYGDIVPVTAFAKFVPMVANFFHVFMIVIFFNVLISFLLSPGDGIRATVR